MKTLIVIAVLIGGLLLMWAASAQAHDWYTDRVDPVTNSRCCGGTDCGPVPLDANWVEPTPDGLRVTMTVAEVQTINKSANHGLNTTVPWARVQTLPAVAKADKWHHKEAAKAIYHICIMNYIDAREDMGRTGGIFCIFAATGT
jgi:hypothetical protein